MGVRFQGRSKGDKWGWGRVSDNLVMRSMICYALAARQRAPSRPSPSSLLGREFLEEKRTVR